MQKSILGVRNVQNNQYVQHVSLHEINIQSQRLAENVLNRDSILLSNRMQSFSVTVLVHFCFLWINEKISVFPFQETPTLTLTFHQNGCTIGDPDSRKR